MRILMLTCILAACGAPIAAEDGPNDSFITDGKADTAGIAEGSPDALGVLALVNGADYDTLHKSAKLAARAAHNIIAHRDGDDLVAGTADDDLYDDLKELDAIPYVGPVAFKQLLQYARAHAAGGDWSSAIAAAPSTTQVELPGREEYCRGACTYPADPLQLDLTVSRAADGTVQLAFDYATGAPYTFPENPPPKGSYPARPVGSDGRFDRTEQFDFDGGHGVMTIQGHFEGGRIIVVDYFGYFFDYNYADWTDYEGNNAAASARF